MTLIKSEDRKGEGFLNTYYCNWCGIEFKQKVMKIIGKCSDHAVCPQCRRTIPTWE